MITIIIINIVTFIKVHASTGTYLGFQGGRDSPPVSIQFNEDGTRLFILDYTNAQIEQRNTASPYQLSGSTLDIAYTTSSFPYVLQFSEDGLYLYGRYSTNGTVLTVRQLTEPFNLSGGVISVNSISYDSRFFVERDDTGHYNYRPTTPVDSKIYSYYAPTARYFSGNTSVSSLDVSDEIGTAKEVTIFKFNKTGKYGYVRSRDKQSYLYEYIFGTPYDLSTAALNQSIYLPSSSNRYRGLDFNADGSIAYFSYYLSNAIARFDLTGIVSRENPVAECGDLNGTFTTYASRNVALDYQWASGDPTDGLCTTGIPSTVERIPYDKRQRVCTYTDSESIITEVSCYTDELAPEDAYCGQDRVGQTIDYATRNTLTQPVLTGSLCDQGSPFDATDLTIMTGTVTGYSWKCSPPESGGIEMQCYALATGTLHTGFFDTLDNRFTNFWGDLALGDVSLSNIRNLANDQLALIRTYLDFSYVPTGLIPISIPTLSTTNNFSFSTIYGDIDETADGIYSKTCDSTSCTRTVTNTGVSVTRQKNASYRLIQYFAPVLFALAFILLQVLFFVSIIGLPIRFLYGFVERFQFFFFLKLGNEFEQARGNFFNLSLKLFKITTWLGVSMGILLFYNQFVGQFYAYLKAFVGNFMDFVLTHLLLSTSLSMFEVVELVTVGIWGALIVYVIYQYSLKYGHSPLTS